MFSICRFCLGQDDAYLIPLKSLSEFAVSMQDLLLCTGIQINDDLIPSYAMCLECTNKLKIASTFRQTCLSNDALFHELCAMLVASAEATREETVEYLESEIAGEATTCHDEFKVEPVECGPSETDCDTNSLQEILYEEEYIQEYLEDISTNSSTAEALNDDTFSYSANYIRAGESLSDDDEQEPDNVYKNIRPPHFIKRKGDIPMVGVICSEITNSTMRDDSWFENDRPSGQRKLHLCDKCGLKTQHLKSHLVNHQEDCAEACPHCPKKFKQKNSLASHIKTVHMKMIGKTCTICGKGFIHHKTYRYHMLTHQSEGKSFECKPCSKTFVNEVYLRDHFNRLHNLARNELCGRKRHTEQQ
ncbi:zinc finger protein 615-like [Anopheles maculipalpis]|uniref:zinc finger protein 615-like n=1 Tax=Anopheles maculipalpis TaxID=1496333 RepID=UPI0021590EDE|nr:zinc finger protein 615-like [Anopheles maculipalpis]